eukprot:5364174-Pleurochrysis_carterae.AAC.1
MASFAWVRKLLSQQCGQSSSQVYGSGSRVFFNAGRVATARAQACKPARSRAAPRGHLSYALGFALARP